LLTPYSKNQACRIAARSAELQLCALPVGANARSALRMRDALDDLTARPRDYVTSWRLRRILLPPRRRPFRHLFWRDVLRMRSDAPLVAKRINKLPVTVPPKHVHGWHRAFGAFRDRFVKNGVNVGHIDHHAGGRWCSALRRHRTHLRVFVTQHQDVIADLEFGVGDLGTAEIVHTHHFGRAVNVLVELDCFGSVSYDSAWNQRIVPIRD